FRASSLVRNICMELSLVPVQTTQTPARKNYRTNKTADSECSVCGKPATGTHYLSVSCNGCRSFFRRSIALEKRYDCKRAGFGKKECFLRHRCKQCRMALCLESGMNPEGVQTEGTMEDRPNDDYELPDDLHEMTPLGRHHPKPIEQTLDRFMQDLLMIESAHDRLRISKYTPMMNPELVMEELAYGPSKLGIDFGPMRATPYPPVSVYLFPLEIAIKKRVVSDFSNFDYSSRKLWTFQDVVYSIEFIKALPFFHLLDYSSKRVLIASALACSNLTSAFYSYCHHSDRTCYPDGGTMSWSAEIHAQSPDSTRFHTKTIAAMREVQLDTREYTLLKVMLICNPLLNGLTPNEVTLLQQEKERSAKTLLSYVLSRRGVTKGPEIYAQLLSVIDVVYKLTTFQRNQQITMLGLGLHKYRIPFNEEVFYSS
ncbi:hypothetical protein PFISCL1PPCAC_6871, partial [Pristionchus fissidentatus]